MSDDHRFGESERAAIYRVIAERRDMRHFHSDSVSSHAQTLIDGSTPGAQRGLMQPWRFNRF
jgi:5,6-dimethylbenzimidazole synthase